MDKELNETKRIIYRKVENVNKDLEFMNRNPREVMELKMQ